jgi:hypothetical protein
MKITIIYKYCFVVLGFTIFQSSSFAKNAENVADNLSCANNPKMQQARFKELLTLVKADQDDRKDSSFKNMTLDKILQISRNDLQRRKRVGEIFAEGCLKNPRVCKFPCVNDHSVI